jgi:hypothetical protein
MKTGIYPSQPQYTEFEIDFSKVKTVEDIIAVLIGLDITFRIDLDNPTKKQLDLINEKIIKKKLLIYFNKEVN